MLLRNRNENFMSFVRQQIICLIIFISLYLLSYWMTSLFKSKSESDSLYAGDEDYFVYRISAWICSASLAISIGSVALLPFSVLSSELLHRYPDNYYLQWMSWPLINVLWNYVFALSNLSLFVLLPFSYFFIESQGFSKSKNGIMQRVYETLAVCALLIVLILCLVDIVLALISSPVSLITITSVNLPLIYSFVSFGGVMLLLLSTPIGFAKIFTIVGETAMIPDHNDVVVERLEKYCEIRAKDQCMSEIDRNFRSSHDAVPLCSLGPQRYPALRLRSCRVLSSGLEGSGDCADGWGDSYYLLSSSICGHMHDSGTSHSSLHENGGCSSGHPEKAMDSSGGTSRCTTVTSQVWAALNMKSHRWFQQFIRRIRYPATIIILSALTGTSLLMVVINTLKLIFGYRSLPVYAQYIEVHTRHSLGLVGVVVESIIILYVMATSLVGFYSIPFVRTLRPHRARTSLTVIIINCSIILVLSSALPVLANTIGITSFDLLGAYSSLKWLDNFKLVLTYNILFAAATIVCVFSQFTIPVRKGIMRRFRQLLSSNIRQR
ncbi:hypothetical protein KIN20_029473 [Parelaphostrongylus tenuis]|uniref:Uncharacterized protein n=1 Tax=Parelaphostrongylus tenuis TaxID=148309 RepID=A0AAD5R399_PARTN|nr:hypothetical protein KIN20_029473 [Parelaphostrongylus tenuis]